MDTTLDNIGKFTAEDLRNGQPPRTVPGQMVTFGGGIAFHSEAVLIPEH